jgi:protein involved in polysaccharide export with SLBB domain
MGEIEDARWKTTCWNAILIAPRHKSRASATMLAGQPGEMLKRSREAGLLWAVISSVIGGHLRRPSNSLAGAALLVLLGGCAVPWVPRGAEVAAPNAVAEVKHRYRSGSDPEDRGDAEVETVGSAAPRAYTPDGERDLEPGDRRRGGGYLLGPGDGLTIVIQRLPDANYDVVVRPDGYISLPIVDEVQAAGLTAQQLDERLTSLYGGRLVEPDLSVIVTSLREPMVYVLGKVARPGPIPYRQASSAAEALARAGDMLPTADQRSVTVIRLDEDGMIRPLTIKQPLEGKAGRYQVEPYMALAAMRLEPEDVLFVPERGMVRFGIAIEELVKPLSAASAGAVAVLNPWLLIKIIEDLGTNNGTNVPIAPITFP